MGEEISQGKMMQALDWAYDKALNGILGLDSAKKLAEDYLEQSGSLKNKADSLIRWQNSKCATSGFISGLGGIITLPVAIPVNIASVMYVQIRMIAAIAYLGGYNIEDDRVKSLVYVCLLGNASKDVFKEIGINLGTKLSKSAIEKISGQVIIKINQIVGFRLVTKFGTKGLINLGKAVPLMGGLIGGGMDLLSTNIMGNVARNTFID